MNTATTRRIVILIFIGFPSFVMLWYISEWTSSSLLIAWVEGMALLVAQLATLMGFIRPRPYQQRALGVAIPLILIFLVVRLLFDYEALNRVLPGYPLARETVAWYRLRLAVGSVCLACYVAGFVLLVRTRRW